jgi:alanine racemase
MSNQYRRTYAEINLPNLYKNYKNVEKIVKTKKVIPVVKANAYGHGVLEVVSYLYDRNVDYFAVSLLEEALEIRKQFYDTEILVMGIVENEGLLIASENNITVTISNSDQLQNMPKLTKKLKIHVKIDSGMNRLGFKEKSEFLNNFNKMKENDMIYIEGIYTHFATADNVDKTYYDIQMMNFKEFLNLVRYDFDMVHISNSSSSIKYETNVDFTTHVRLGISLYGLTLDEGMDFLENTYQLRTKISQLKKLYPGDKVGYGATYTAKKEEIIVILPIGYADGFIRKNQGGDVEINGKRYPIIGRICMDQMFIKIDETVSKEDDVILFGGIVSIDEVAERLETINYEIICQITSRVPKKYIK